MKYYFFGERPKGALDAIQVRILSTDGLKVRARLSKPFARAVGKKVVTIELPVYPWGTNCVDMGETRGAVFVPVSGMVQRDKEVRLFAVPTRGRPFSPPRSLSEIDRYIVDPAMKKAAEESRLNQ
ncbi:hypothetical protein J2W22_000167 [Sphingomonas kyeonggiensis]|uniref:hypothetical protein n=1 Tax=Sphingomonas kyeonggiensis TaxID=1268553 RepID=UPI0027876FC2|nr:hypothetical protein [Sphingomonas kyeonggiensis]MDQ0248120.1 hypothetical protein [Sphingomonas kyeonggiensis]